MDKRLYASGPSCRFFRTILPALLLALGGFPLDGSPAFARVVAPPQFHMTDALTGDVNGNGLVNGGDVVTYTLIIDPSPGGLTLDDLTFQTNVDPSSTLVVGSVTTTRGTVLTGNGAGDTSVEVDVGMVLATETVTITFAVQVVSPLPPGVTQLSCQGKVAFFAIPIERDKTGSQTDDPDTPELDDPTITPLAPDVTFTVQKRSTLVLDSNGNGLLDPGETLEYAIVVTHQGSDPALGVVLNDTPGVNTTLVVGSVSSTQGVVTSGNLAGDTSVGVNIGDMAPGAVVTVVFRVNVDIPLPPTVIQVANQGFLGGSNFPTQPTDDPDTPAPNDPTIDPLAGAPGPQQPEPIPTLDSLGILVLGAALSGLALRRLRRRGHRTR